MVTGRVWKTGHGCHLLVHGGVWHPRRGCWLEGRCSSLRTAPGVRLWTTPRTCPLKSRTLTSFPQLHAALLQVGTRRPWTSHCNNKKQITVELCKDTLQALTNTRGIFKACLAPCFLSFPLPLAGTWKAGQKGASGSRSPVPCYLPLRGFLA